MLQPAGVVVILQSLGRVGKAEGGAHFHLVIRLILTVAAGGTAFNKAHRRDGVQPGDLLHIIHNAVLIAEGLLGFFAAALIAQHQAEPCVHHSLPLHGFAVIFQRHTDVGKHLGVRLPADNTAGAAALEGLFLQPADIFALAEIQVVVIAVTVDIRCHPLAGILRGAKAQAVQAQAEFIVVFVLTVLAACIHFAEQQLPVIALFTLIVIHGHTAAKVLHLHAAVFIAGQNDLIAVALAGFIDGVGKDLKNRMGAAVHTV